MYLDKLTFELYWQGVNPVIERRPTSICTETLVCNKSTPEDCRAWVRVPNILFKQTTTQHPIMA